MIYRKVYRKRTVSPDGRVVTESTSFVETSIEEGTDNKQQVSVKVTAQSGYAGVSVSGQNCSVSGTASISSSGYAVSQEIDDENYSSWT